MRTESTRGASLVELLTALVLGALVIGLAGRTLLHAAETVRRAVAHDDRGTARRVARLTLRSELAALSPGDVRSSGGDSIRIRAFRVVREIGRKAGNGSCLKDGHIA